MQISNIIRHNLFIVAARGGVSLPPLDMMAGGTVKNHIRRCRVPIAVHNESFGMRRQPVEICLIVVLNLFHIMPVPNVALLGSPSVGSPKRR